MSLAELASLPDPLTDEQALRYGCCPFHRWVRLGFCQRQRRVEDGTVEGIRWLEAVPECLEATTRILGARS